MTYEPPPLTRAEPIDGWTGDYARFVDVRADRTPTARTLALTVRLDPRVDVQRVLAMIGAVLTGLDRQAAAELDPPTDPDLAAVTDRADYLDVRDRS